MTEEFLDIVSENNELTGESAPRSRVHAEGLWHRTVHIYLFRKVDDEIEFLVHLRSPFKDLNPNKWDTRFGGHLKSGTTIKEGVRAELKEEIGIDVDPAILIEGITNKRDKFPNKEFSKIYYLEYNDGLGDLKFNDGEVQEVKWKSISEIKKSMAENKNEWSGSLSGFTDISDYLLKKI